MDLPFGRSRAAPNSMPAGGEDADLLILDIAMPDGTPVDARRVGCGSVPILMLTAAADIVDRVVGLESAPTTT
jgi:DNA-binding response OmpR family regulator